MKSVFKLSSSRLALVAAFGLTAAAYTPAAAADLGGDCCADLEERVAELEATTARKGNRKVSLTISGWVNEGVFVWDDGSKSNVYVGTNGLEQSRFKLVGEAKILPGYSAGYELEVGLEGDPSNQWNQTGPNSQSKDPTKGNNALIVRKSNWWLKSDQLGKVAVGLNGTATYHVLDDADAANTRLYADAEAPSVYMSAFQLRHNGAAIGGLKWTDALRGFNNATPGQSGRRNVVRYDSPTIEGFTVSAAWGENDLWDMALTFKHDFGDFAVLAKAGYGQSNDPGQNDPAGLGYVQGGTTCISGSNNASSLPGFQCDWAGAAATVKHNPTGLYVYGGWGWQHISTDNAATEAKLINPNSNTWFIQPGIEQKWLALGKTTLFGEYRRDNAGSNPGNTVKSNINFWQGGIVQNIEPAAMDLYLIYQHADGDIYGNAATAGKAPVGKTSLDAFDEVIMGALIKF